MWGSRVLRAIAPLLVATVLAGALAPCPPAAGAIDPAARADAAAAAAPAHDTVVRQVAADDGWCKSPPRFVLAARCACGCGERPAALGSPIGIGLALVSRASLDLAPPVAVDAAPPSPERAPHAPVLAVDHVPRPA